MEEISLEMLEKESATDTNVIGLRKQAQIDNKKETLKMFDERKPLQERSFRNKLIAKKRKDAIKGKQDLKEKFYENQIEEDDVYISMAESQGLSL